MNFKRLSYIYLSSILLAACSDDVPVEPGQLETTGEFAICYSTDDYGMAMSRAESSLCWSDLNERKVENLDFYLINSEGKITHHKALITESVSDLECNVAQEIIKFDADATGIVPTFEDVAKASKIALVANYPVVGGDVIGKTLKEIYSSDLTGLVHNEIQNKFVMYGEIDVPENLSRFRKLVVPLRRIVAKIRVTLTNPDNTEFKADNFNSMLCRYVTKTKFFPESLFPEFSGVDVAITSLSSTTSVDVENKLSSESSSWEYTDDITSKGIIRATDTNDNGHIYYTYPSDWIDYNSIKNQCTRKDGFHADHKDERYEILDYDDKAPVNADREMFVIVKAPYNCIEYFYKVPINYRFAEINDYQCFSKADLTDKIFPLYRADRNTFYDIKVLIDRAGGATPATAVNATISIRTDSGFIPYIKDPINVTF